MITEKQLKQGGIKEKKLVFRNVYITVLQVVEKENDENAAHAVAMRASVLTARLLSGFGQLDRHDRVRTLLYSTPPLNVRNLPTPNWLDASAADSLVSHWSQYRLTAHQLGRNEYAPAESSRVHIYT